MMNSSSFIIHSSSFASLKISLPHLYNARMTERGTGTRVGYLELLRVNHDFRRLFVGQLVSQTGDWFHSVALFTLLLSLSGSGAAVGYVLIIKVLPSFFFGPLSVPLANRLNRQLKTLLPP